MIDKLDWDKLKVLQIVAELGSMNAAANRLGESPPTVSRKIDDLERSLNAVLLDRSPRGVKLTEAGRKTLQYVQLMVDAAEGIRSDVADFDQHAEGRVTLATGDGLGAHWIAPRLPKFHLANPKIELRLRILDTTPDLISGEADISVQFTEPNRQDLICKRLGILHYMFFASQEYIDTYGQPTSLFELHRHRCILHEGYVNQIARWAPKSKELKEVIDLALITNSGAAMMAVCANGGGIAVLPSYVCDLDSRLIPIELPEVAPIQFWLTYTERIRRLARGQIVIEWIRSIFDPKQTNWFRDSFIHPSKAFDQTRISASENAYANIKA